MVLTSVFINRMRPIFKDISVTVTNDRMEGANEYLSIYNHLASKLYVDHFTWENIEVIFDWKKYLNSFVFHEMTAVLVVALDVYIG